MRPPTRSPVTPSAAPARRSRRSRGAIDTNFAMILNTTLDGLRTSLNRDMPAGPLRTYWRWGLDRTGSQHLRFVQAIGARQLCRLTVTLLEDLVGDDEWAALTPLVTTMNVYQLYEIISDNLGIGLLPSGAIRPGGDSRDVLHGFNSAAATALSRGSEVTTSGRGTPRGGGSAAGGGSPAGPEVAALLGPIRRKTARLSGFAHSLAGPAHATMAASLAAQRGRPTVSAVEYGLWPALVANIVAAWEVADRLADHAIGPTLRSGLVSRYLAVNRTLEGQHLPLFELATVGAHAILVAPTLAYYLGALGELPHPDPAFAGCVVDGTLPEALGDAALLVRLLNDVGPVLLTCTDPARRAVWRTLRAAHAAEPSRFSTLESLLLTDLRAPAGAPSTALTRLRKDLRYGEFNVALHGPRQATSVPAALDALAGAIDYFAVLYRLHSNRLATGLTALSSRLADRRPLRLIDRFVRFHEELYAHPYHDTTGEYSV